MCLSGTITVLAGAFLWRSAGLSWGIFPIDWELEKPKVTLPMATAAAIAITYVLWLVF